MSGNSRELSIVVTARNDGHGGDFLHRMQLFVSGLLEQGKRIGADFELITVEWNPPEDRPRLADALVWPSKTGACSVRIIEVPAKVHAQYRYAEKLSLYQMIAKNMGIRRAHGTFILATNVDVLFSDELIEFLASRRMNSSFFYRANRYDVPSDIPADLSTQEQLHWCEQHVLRVNAKDGTFDQRIVGSTRTRSYVRMPAPLYRTWARFIRDLSIWREMVNHLSPVTTVFGFQPPYPLLHTNACGDFTLLSRESWFALRGYPELDMHSWHLDSILLHMAHAYGLTELVLEDPMRVYHIEHDYPWPPWLPEWDARVKAAKKSLGIPILDSSQVESWATRMHKEKRPIIFNTENWGLASESLPEKIVR